MVKVTKMGDTNCNPKLECDFCKELVPLVMSFFSVTITADWNPPQSYTACEKCANTTNCIAS